jgi:hypothetical protein
VRCRALAAVAALFFCTAAHAADVSVRSRVYPATMTIGGEIKVFYEVLRPSDVKLKPPTEKLKADPFEVKLVRVLETKPVAGDYKDTIVLTVTVFETGELTFPSVPIGYETSRGARDNVWTKPLKIKVTPVSRAEDKKIKPIKDILPSDLRALRAALLGALALVLFAVLGALVWRRRQTRKAKIDPETLKAPHERALLELGRLEKKPLLEEGLKKDYYGGLTQVLKTYLGRQFGFAAADLTTAEILQEVKGGPMDEIARRELKEFLDDADLVKFAGFSPSPEQTERSTERVREIVRRTTPKPEKSEAAG